MTRRGYGQKTAKSTSWLPWEGGSRSSLRPVDGIQGVKIPFLRGVERGNSLLLISSIEGKVAKYHSNGEAPVAFVNKSGLSLFTAAVNFPLEEREKGTRDLRDIGFRSTFGGRPDRAVPLVAKGERG